MGAKRFLDKKRSIFTSTNAGHNQPLLFRSDGRIERLGEGGLILGFQPDVQYDQQTVAIRPGEVIVLYTDGITEAADPSSDMVMEVVSVSSLSVFNDIELIKVLSSTDVLYDCIRPSRFDVRLPFLS